MKTQRGGPVQLKPDDLEYSTRKSPEMARIGGGSNAKFGVLAVALVLVGIIWVAVSGRPPATPISAATQPGVAGLPSRADAASPVPTPSPVPSPPRPLDSYGVLLDVGNVGYITTLDQLGVEHFSAVLRVPIPLAQDKGTLEFKQVWASYGIQRTQLIGSWRLPLSALDDAGRESTVLVDKDVAARPKLLNVPAPIQRGYHVTVSAVNNLLFGLLSVEITLGPRVGIDGDDGIFGWPTIRNLDGSPQPDETSSTR